MTPIRRIAVILLITCFIAACGLTQRITPASTQFPTRGPNGTAAELSTARAKIKHIVIIMQENRSFDSYFGTYPGADGIPVKNGKFTVCVNDPATGNCIYPFHDAADKNYGGPHAAAAAAADIDGGKMDGFIAQAERSQNGLPGNAFAKLRW